MTAARVVTSGIGPLRAAVEGLSGAIVDVCAAHGMPIIAADDAPLWDLVWPVSNAVHDSYATLGSRSTSKLEHARQQLLAAAVALGDPKAYAARRGPGRANLAIVVPGPDGAIPEGVIDCELDRGTRVVRWYPDGWTGRAELLSVVAGRPPEFRYRWADRRVWDQLALDLIVVCCGWQRAPQALPPALSRARAVLANQLRADISKGTWALRPATVVGWLERAGVVTRLPDEPVT